MANLAVLQTAVDALELEKKHSTDIMAKAKAALANAMATTAAEVKKALDADNSADEATAAAVSERINAVAKEFGLTSTDLETAVPVVVPPPPPPPPPPPVG
jgi:hypothetical protein